MGYRDYIATTTCPGDQVLEDWRWLVGPKARLWMVTKAGDAILRDPSDGSVHWLDVLYGRLERIGADDWAFEKGVLSAANAEKWLRKGIVDARAAAGVSPGPEECLSLDPLPVLGGEVVDKGFHPCDVAVHFSMAGQIHFQVKDLPDGTWISGVQVRKPKEG